MRCSGTHEQSDVTLSIYVTNVWYDLLLMTAQ